MSTTDTKSSRIFFSCNGKRGKEQKQPRSLVLSGEQAGVIRRCWQLDVQFSAPLKPAQQHRGSRKHNFLQIIVIFPVTGQRNTLGREQRREELCFPSKAWCSFGSPQGLRKGRCADSYQQKHKALLSPAGKYELIPRSAEPPRLDANNMVSSSGRTKRTHTSLFTVLCGETRTSSEVHIWSKEWPKQVISSGVPAGGPAGVSLHPGVDPKQNSPARAKAAGRLEGKLGKGPRGKSALLLPTLPWLHG